MRLLPLLLLFSALPALAETPPLELVVADAKVLGAAETLGPAVTHALAEEAASLGLSVHTIEDLRKLAQFEQMKQALGCESEDCDAAKLLAEAAKADRLLVPTISQLGEDRILTLVLFDTKSGKVLKRTSREAASDAAVLERARDAAHLLVSGSDRAVSVPRVAVLYFDNSGKKDELEPLKKGLADMLVSDLGRTDAVQIVERDRLEEILAELKLQESKAIDPGSAVKVGKLLGAQFLVIGGYFEMLGSLRIDARIVKVETGAIEKSVGVNGKRDDFFDLEQKLVTSLAAGLGTKLRESSEPKPEAALGDALEYAKAVELLDKGQRKEAGEKLKTLAAKRPNLKQAQKLARKAGL